ncbi:MAG TPA: flavodoxin family protein [Clostridia bacterium]|nr:flavodoxin family protein [Clostridia bacterium]
MRVLAIQGSPRKKGNTALLLKHYLHGVEKSQPDVEIDRVFLQEKNITPCTGCYTCVNQKTSCIINDDMQELYGKIVDADLLVFATPIYWWSISAQLKTFIDRFCPLNVADFKGKKFALLMTYGMAQPNTGPQMVEDMFREIWGHFDVDFAQSYGTCTEQYLPVAENKRAQEDVYRLGNTIFTVP